MRRSLEFLLALLCIATLTPCHATEAFPPEFRQVEAWIRCAETPRPWECRAQLPERFDTPFARVARGYAVLLTPAGEAEADPVRIAYEDFQWASDRGYFPAYHGLAMAVGRTNQQKGFEWLLKAVESGLTSAASYLTDHRGPGRDLLSLEDYLVYKCIAAHPATIDSTDFLRDMWERRNEATPDSEMFRERYMKMLQERAAIKLEVFERTCTVDDPYFWDATPAILERKKQTVRKRLASTLGGIRQQLKRYPELRFFSSPEHLSLLPTFKPRQ